MFKLKFVKIQNNKKQGVVRRAKGVQDGWRERGGDLRGRREKILKRQLPKTTFSFFH